MMSNGPPVRELTRVTRALLAVFALIAGSAVYWGVWAADDLRQREDNARNVIAEQQIRRGAIYDQDGEALAYSEADERGIMVRHYPHPEAAAAVGYYSLTYDTAGIEAAYDEVLRGDDWRDDWQAWFDDLLHRPQQGRDVRTTLDLDVQRAAADTLAGRQGAVVVVAVPSGRIVALVSQPGYDPNTLDDTWDVLAADEATSPLLNRVMAGLYQPGSALQTVVLSAMLAAQPEPDPSGEAVLAESFETVTAPVVVDGVMLSCLAEPPDGTGTLLEAYAYGCPAPFVAAMEAGITPEQLWERFGVLGLLEPPALVGFETVAGPRLRPLTENTATDTLRAELAGQGALTVTPLHMVQIVAAIANGGNAVPLHLVDAVRTGEDWEAVESPGGQPALLRQDVAEALRQAMAFTAATNPLLSPYTTEQGGWHGHLARSFGGPDKTPFAWFVGFVAPSDGTEGETLVAVVVVEDEPDPAVAARVAAAAFEAVEARPAANPS